MRLLLDTHVFLWAAADDPRLTGDAREAITDRQNDLFLSVLSAWEIVIKHGLGRLELPQAPVSYVRSRMSMFGMSRLPMEFEHLAQVSELPRIHRDPFDRLLVAQAQTEGLSIVTGDENITRYDVAVVW
jgi:PIN domain nuclease of toxin-antitoxin system